MFRRCLCAAMAVASALLLEAAVLGAATTASNPDERANRAYQTQVDIAERNVWPKQEPACSFVIMNDLHVYPSSPPEALASIIKRLNPMKPQFAVFAGDLNASQSASIPEREDAMKALMAATRDIADFPCYYAMGNTDMAPGDDPAVVFRKWTNGQTHYSFNCGGVHFVVLYTGQDKPARFGIVDKEQLEWLKKDLESMKKGMPVVLFGHHPLYDDAAKWEKDNWAIENSAELMALLQPYHLIATFAGHRHLNRMSLDKRGILHVINGTMVGDHSDDVGPKHDGIGYRWVRITSDKIVTTWIRIGEYPVGK